MGERKKTLAALVETTGWGKGVWTSTPASSNEVALRLSDGPVSGSSKPESHGAHSCSINTRGTGRSDEPPGWWHAGRWPAWSLGHAVGIPVGTHPRSTLARPSTNTHWDRRLCAWDPPGPHPMCFFICVHLDALGNKLVPSSRLLSWILWNSWTLASKLIKGGCGKPLT